MSDTATPHRVPSSGRVGNGMLCQFALKGSTSQAEQREGASRDARGRGGGPNGSARALCEATDSARARARTANFEKQRKEKKKKSQVI